MKIARAATSKLPLEQLQADHIRRLAAERALEIISEASRYIPPDLKADAPEIPWKSIAGIGNVIRHNYPNVSGKMIMDLIRNDFEPLEAALRKMQEQYPPDEEL